jgi:hypothetical protein
MRNQTVVRKLSWLLAMCFALALALSACRSADEHSSAEHPTKEHPEHPTTNAPPRNP